MSLRLVDIRKRYGRQEALGGVSLHVRPGDCYGFLGHNGAGKTTALRIALGLIRPDAGRILVEGFDAARHPREARARQGGLIEMPGFYPWLTGRANLVLLAGLSGLSRREAAREADRLLEVVGLSSSGDRRVGGYSQGMRQRLGVAQALLGDPSQILLDEPLNGLDPEGVEELRRLLVRLVREEGRTVLLSSHQLPEVAGICNRIGILREGRLLLEAETRALLEGAGGGYLLRTDDDEAAAGVLARAGVALSPATGGGFLFDPAAHAPGEVAERIVRGGLRITELRPRPVTLEEIYLRVSRGEAVLSGGEADPAPAPVAPRSRRAPPRPLLRAAAAELAKTFSHPGPYVLLALPVLLAGLSVARQWAGSAGDLEAVRRGDLFSRTLVTAFEGTAVALAAALPLAALVLAGLASQALAGDLSRGTLRNLLLRPVGRTPLVLGKAAAVLAAALAGYALVAGTAVGGAGLAFDFTDVVEIMETRSAEPWVVARAADLRPELLRVVPLMFLPLAAYAMLGFLAGAVTRRGVSALALSAGGVIFLDLARTVGRELGFERWLLSAYLPSPLGDTSLLAGLLDRIRAPNDLPRGYAEGAVLVPLAWLAACLLLSVLAVRRRSVP